MIFILIFEYHIDIFELMNLLLTIDYHYIGYYFYFCAWSLLSLLATLVEVPDAADPSSQSVISICRFFAELVLVVCLSSRLPTIRSHASTSRACPGPLGRYGSAYQYSTRRCTRQRIRHLYHRRRPNSCECNTSNSLESRNSSRAFLAANARLRKSSKSMPRII